MSGQPEAVARIAEMLVRHVSSPSLRHMRDPLVILDLAIAVAELFASRSAVWKEWDRERESVLLSSLGCWVPEETLQEFLNTLPGPSLTITDVTERK